MGISAVVIVNAILARHLSYEEFRHYFVAKSVAALLGIVAMMGWNSAVVRCLPERRVRGDFAGAEHILKLAFGTIAISGLVCLLSVSSTPGHGWGNGFTFRPNLDDGDRRGMDVRLGLASVSWQAMRACHEQRFANLFSGEVRGAFATRCFALRCWLRPR